MGLQLLHQNEILFAQPVSLTSLNSAALREMGDDASMLDHISETDRELDQLSTTTEQLVGAMRQAQYQLSTSFGAFIEGRVFLSLLELRNEVVDHIEKVEHRIAGAESSLSLATEVHEQLVASFEGQPKFQAKHRRQYSRFVEFDQKAQKQRRAYIQFIRSQLLPKLDARLHEAKPAERSFDDGVNSLLDRYPVVAEYLAR